MGFGRVKTQDRFRLKGAYDMPTLSESIKIEPITVRRAEDGVEVVVLRFPTVLKLTMADAATLAAALRAVTVQEVEQ